MGKRPFAVVSRIDRGLTLGKRQFAAMSRIDWGVTLGKRPFAPGYLKILVKTRSCITMSMINAVELRTKGENNVCSHNKYPT